MKNFELIKILKSQKDYSNEVDIVKLIKEYDNYSVEYKYASMSKWKVYKTNDFRLAELDFLKIAMFILS